MLKKSIAIAKRQHAENQKEMNREKKLNNKRAQKETEKLEATAKTQAMKEKTAAKKRELKEKLGAKKTRDLEKISQKQQKAEEKGERMVQSTKMAATIWEKMKEKLQSFKTRNVKTPQIIQIARTAKNGQQVMKIAKKHGMYEKMLILKKMAKKTTAMNAM